MADELGSKLGFDVSAAIASLNTLKREFDSYSANLLKTAGSTDKFNTEQSQVDKVLTAASASAERAAAGLKGYTSSMAAAESQTRSFLNVQKQFQLKSFNAGAPPLEQQVANVTGRQAAATAAEAERLQSQSDARAIASFNQKIAFQRQLNQLNAENVKEQFRAGDNAARNAFGRPSIPLGSEFAKQEKDVKGSINEIGLSYKSLLKIFATQIVFSALGNFISAAKQGVTEAIAFETQLGQIQTISEEFKTRGLNDTAETVRKLSDQFGAPIADVASGLYETLSNQVGNAAESVQFLTTALTFSKGAVTTTADAVDLLSGIINAYGLTSASAANISDQLFVTIDRGRVKGEDLANTFGRVAPLAATLGVDISELNTALAELTIQGVKPSDALTQITNVILKLAKPSEELKKVFDGMGIASAEAGIAIHGFDGFLRKIAETTDGSVTELGKLFNQIRGTRGVIGIVGRDNEKYAETLREIQTASRETSRSIEAANTVLKTPGQQLTIELNKAKNFLINDFGRSVVGVLVSFTQNILSAKNAVVALGSVTAGVGLVFGLSGSILLAQQFVVALKFINTSFLTVSGSATTAAGSVSIFTAALGTVAIAAAGVAAIRFFSDTTSIFTKASEDVRAFNDKLAENVRTQVQALEEVTAARKAAVTKQIGDITGFFAKLNVLVLKDRQEAIKLQTEVTGNFKDQLDKRESLLTSFLNRLEQAQKNSAANIQRINEQGRETQLAQQSNRFERDLKGLDPNQQANLIATRIQKIVQAARQAFNEGTAQGTEFGNQLLKDAFGLANRIADSDETRARGEGIINNLLREQKSIQSNLVSQEQAKAAAAKITEDNIKGTVLETRQQIDEFNQLQKSLQTGLGKNGEVLSEAQITDIARKVQELGGKIQSNLQKIGTEKIPQILGLQDLQRQLLEPFVDPFTKQLTSLQAAAQSAMTKVIETLNKTADAQPVEVKVLFKALTGQELNGLNAGEAQTAAAQLVTKLKQGIENEKNLPNLKAQIDAASGALDRFIAATIATGQATKTLADRSGAAFANGLGIPALALGATFGIAQGKVDEFGVALRKLQDTGVEAALAGDAKALNDVDKQLAALQTAAQTTANQPKGFFAQLFGGDANAAQTFAANIANARQQLATLGVAQQNFNQASQKQQNNKSIEEALSTGNAGALLALSQLAAKQNEANQNARNFGSSTQNGINTAEGAIQTFSTQQIVTQFQEATAASNAFTQQAIANAERVQAANAAARAATQAEARGGFIHHFANGGFAPRGTDTVPAMLSPGEFIVNAASTRRFYSDLVAINAGVRPTYRASGGPVSNTTNVGDVIVNVSGGSGPVNGRGIAKEIRRELRRGTSRI